MSLSIIVDWRGVRANYPSWKRRVIGVWVHELVHLFQWLVLYKRDATRWNKSKKELEVLANRVQDLSLNLMLVPRL